MHCTTSDFRSLILCFLLPLVIRRDFAGFCTSRFAFLDDSVISGENKRANSRIRGISAGPSTNICNEYLQNLCPRLRGLPAPHSLALAGSFFLKAPPDSRSASPHIPHNCVYFLQHFCTFSMSCVPPQFSATFSLFYVVRSAFFTLHILTPFLTV